MTNVSFRASRRTGTALAVVVCLLSAPAAARADFITIANIDFRTNAFADTLQSSYSGTNGFFFGPAIGGVPPTSVGQAVLGSYLGDFALSPAQFSFLQLGFTDNVLRNGPGADLVLFDLGEANDRFAVSVLPSLSPSSFREYQSTFTGAYFGSNMLGANQVNAAYIDLSDFGLAQGAQLSSITVGLYPTTPYRGQDNRSSFTAAGALYSDPVQPSAVPAPPAVVLALVGAPFIGFAVRRNRRQRAAQAVAA